MTADVVKWVLDELGAVVDDQPTAHPLWRVDRDNSLVYEGDGDFDISRARPRTEEDLRHANLVGARFADRSASYIGTAPDLDLEAVVGVRVSGLTSREYGHIDPTGDDGVVFQGTDDSLVQDCTDALYDALKFPDAGRTPVSFTGLRITNATPSMAEWQDGYSYDFDVTFSGFERL